MFHSPKFAKVKGGGGSNNVLHKNYQPSDIHTPFNWVVANAAARALLTPLASDVYKALYQIDTGTVYVLTDESPVTWVAITSSSAVDAGSRWVESLLDFRGLATGAISSITDAVGLNRWTALNATIAASGGENYINGTGAYAEQICSGPNSWLEGDFTVEAFSILTGINQNLIALGTDGGTGRLFIVANASGQLHVDRQGIAGHTLTGTNFVNNTLAHWHVSRREGVLFGGIAGIGTITTALLGDIGKATNTMRLALNSNIKHRDIRFTNGRTRYLSGNYVVPTVPYAVLR